MCFFSSQKKLRTRIRKNSAPYIQQQFDVGGNLPLFHQSYVYFFQNCKNQYSMFDSNAYALSNPLFYIPQTTIQSLIVCFNSIVSAQAIIISRNCFEVSIFQILAPASIDIDWSLLRICSILFLSKLNHQIHVGMQLLKPLSIRSTLTEHPNLLFSIFFAFHVML